MSSPTVARVARPIALAALLTLQGVAGPAHGCPRCAPGEQARSEFWGGEFSRYVAAVLLPFVIVGAAGAYAERAGRKRVQRAGPELSSLTGRRHAP